jgi:hypothetical protein
MAIRERGGRARRWVIPLIKGHSHRIPRLLLIAHMKRSGGAITNV